MDCLLLLDCSRPRPDSAPEIGDCEIEHLASSATDDGLDHVEGEPLGHLKGDLGRDDKFFSIYNGIDKHRPVMSEGGRDPRLHVCRVLDPNLRQNLAPETLDILLRALAQGLHQVYLITGALVLLVAITAWLLPRGLSPIRPARDGR